MAQKQGQGNEKTVSMDDPLIIGIFFITVYAAIWALWNFGHTYIATAYGWWRYIQFYAVHALGSVADYPGVRSVHAWISGLCAPDLQGICRREFSTVSWSEISDSSLPINIVLAIVLVLYCVRLFIKANKLHPKIRFAKPHTIKSFVDEQKRIRNPKNGALLYPHLSLFSELDLIDIPLSDPVFGMSETSRQFVFSRRLVADWREEAGGFWAPTIDRLQAGAVFRDQLGNHWTSSANLSPAETLLAAIAIPRVAATDTSLDDKAFYAAIAASDEIIRFCWDQFKAPPGGAKARQGADANAWLKPAIDLTLPREVIKKYIGSKGVQDIIVHHAFNRTVIFALFTQARRLGVLPPAEMRWLRFYDRELWYILQTIGRQAGFAEGAGVLSHFLYEARAGISIVEPQIDKAVSGLEVAIHNFKFTATDKAKYVAEAPPPTPDSELVDTAGAV